MFKRILSLLLVCAALFALAGCGSNGGDAKTTEPAEAGGEYGCSSYTELADTAMELVRTGDAELVKKLYPKSEVDFSISDYAAKDKDYMALLKQEFENAAAKYREVCGDDWQISYEFTDVREKDEAGIQNYREFDEFYFDRYGIDTAKITGAVYVYADVTVTGSLGTFTKQKSCWTFRYEGRWYSFYMPSFGLNIAGK